MILAVIYLSMIIILSIAALFGQNPVGTDWFNFERLLISWGIFSVCFRLDKILNQTEKSKENK